MAWLKEGCGRVDNLDLNVMREADFYEAGTGYEVRCLLCPRLCRIKEGARGKCNVRLNNGGRLFSENHGLLTCLNLDPVEKKPLYHYFPGREILSVGTAGCNFRCPFCQNYNISQSAAEEIPGSGYADPLSVVTRAVSLPGNIGIAYTYNEPVVWYEYMYDIAAKARERGLKNVVVSNGYINRRPLAELLEVTDAFNIDLKSFSDTFYRDVAGGSLAPVKSAMKAIRKSGLHLEVTRLVVTGLSDDEEGFREMTGWIAGELGSDTVLHISRYFPSWRYDAPATPLHVMEKFYEIAAGSLNYVYTGNMPAVRGSSHTRCAGCGTVVIRRNGYRTDATGTGGNGNCLKCGTNVVVTG